MSKRKPKDLKACDQIQSHQRGTKKIKIVFVVCITRFKATTCSSIFNLPETGTHPLAPSNLSLPHEFQMLPVERQFLMPRQLRARLIDFFIQKKQLARLMGSVSHARFHDFWMMMHTQTNTDMNIDNIAIERAISHLAYSTLQPYSSGRFVWYNLCASYRFMRFPRFAEVQPANKLLVCDHSWGLNPHEIAQGVILLVVVPGEVPPWEALYKSKVSMK